MKQYLSIFWMACFFSSFWCVAGQAGWIKQDESSFFPPELAKKIRSHSSFPIFWWDYYIEPHVEPGDLAKLGKLCKDLQTRPELDLVACGDSLDSFVGIAKSWAADFPKRSSYPGYQKVQAALSQTLTKAALPLPPAVMQVLRADPFASYEELQKVSLRQIPEGMIRKEGVLYDEQNKMAVLPVRVKFGPSEAARFEPVFDGVRTVCPECKGAWVGPHASSIENRRQVMSDVELVSLVGTVLFALFAFYTYWIGRFRIFWANFPILIGGSLALMVVAYFFGGVHGLTLSFGVGLVGIAFDYGLHAAVHKGESVWKSNFAGLVTTLIVLIILAFSNVPLLRELMVFAALGLVSAFLVMKVAYQNWGKYLHVAPIRGMYKIRGLPLAPLSVVLIIGALLGIFLLKPDLSLRQFDFQSEAQRELVKWWFQRQGGQVPLFRVVSLKGQSTPLHSALEEKSWAKEQGISVVNFSDYVPDLSTQVAHLATWRSVQCPSNSLSKRASVTEKKFFGPFYENIQCDKLMTFNGTSAETPAYLSQFHTDAGWLSMWLPKDKQSVEKIRSMYPDAYSFLDIANSFPQTLQRELQWQIPAALASILLFLFFYYRSGKLALLAMVPFLCAFGGITWGHFLGLPFSFITLVGVVMLCGMSVDYGIFAVDDLLLRRSGKKEDSEDAIWTALILTGVTTLLGFIPLAISKHQVLSHLGCALSVGIAGTLLGTFWGIPLIAQWVGSIGKAKR